MAKKLTVYIAGAISGRDIEETKIKFLKAKKTIEKTGFVVINPLDHQLKGTTPKDIEESEELYQEQMSVCFKLIDNSDVIFLLPDWKESKGAQLEFEYAKNNNKGVVDSTVENLTEPISDYALSMSEALILLTDILDTHLMNIKELRDKMNSPFVREAKQGYLMIKAGLDKINKLQRDALTTQERLDIAIKADRLYFLNLSIINVLSSEVKTTLKIHNYLQKYTKRSALEEAINQSKENI